jgi:hypothetical protein
VIGLKITCEEYLLQNIHIKNVGHLLTVADMTNAESLKKECLEYTTKHPLEVSASPEFSTSVNKRPYLFKEAFDMLAKKSKKE